MHLHYTIQSVNIYNDLIERLNGIRSDEKQKMIKLKSQESNVNKQQFYNKRNKHFQS